MKVNGYSWYNWYYSFRLVIVKIILPLRKIKQLLDDSPTLDEDIRFNARQKHIVVHGTNRI
jgi:hypothetical protein